MTAASNPVNPTVGARLAEQVWEEVEDRVMRTVEHALTDFELSGDDFYEAASQQEWCENCRSHGIMNT